ncbi:MAG: ABC transporter permease [Clostridium sp.]
MKLRVLIISALRSLNRDRSRSFLTMLGIIIGISSVITIVAIGEAYKNKTIKDFTKGESEEIAVEAVFRAEDSNYESYSKNFKRLIYNDDQKIELMKIPFVKDVEFNYNNLFFSDYVKVDVQGNLFDYSVTKTKDSVINSKVIGRNLTEEDNLSEKKVIVISDDVISEKIKNPKFLLGSVALINGISFEIVGIINKGFDELSTGELQIPERTYYRYFPNEKGIQGLNITLDEKADMNTASSQIEDVLNSMKEVPINGSYEVEDANGLAGLLVGLLVSITTFIALVAGIALLIAGIGLMNMVYTSISERTKEIGIKRALGAKKRDIKREFLIEGVVLTMIGGSIGYVLGIIIAKATSIFIGLKVAPSLFTAVLAIGICVVIGLVSSFIPARKAANCNTVDILK